MVTKKANKTPKAAETAKSAPAVATRLHRRTLEGVVVSDKMMKTRVIRIDRQVRDADYGKIIKRSKKFKFHDENNLSKMGDLVSVVESRPLSREKRWALQKIIRKATGTSLNTIS